MIGPIRRRARRAGRRLFPAALFRAALFALLLVEGAAAQAVTPRGTEATFEVATWNVEWFGSPSNGPDDEERQFEHAAAIIAGSAVDLWAIQEIDDTSAFRRLVAALGDGYEGVHSTLSTNFQVGFIYRTEVVRSVRGEHLLREFAADYFAGRPPFLLRAGVTLPDTTLDLIIITLHMKAGGDLDDYGKRDQASKRLKSRLDFAYPSVPVIVLGDFNDELGRSIASGRPSPYTNFLEDAEAYRFLTAPLDAAGVNTFCFNASCTNGSTLDHILITDELVGAYEEGSASRYEELLTEVDGYLANTSDHIPVVARFDFATGTAVEREAVGPEALDLYPNPAAGRVFLRGRLARAGVLRVELYDLLGRRVAVLADRHAPAGPFEAEGDVAALPAGPYLLRVASAASVESRTLIVSR